VDGGLGRRLRQCGGWWPGKEAKAVWWMVAWEGVWFAHFSHIPPHSVHVH